MEHCCENMEYYAKNKNSLIEYDKSLRSYLFHVYDSEYGTHQMFSYCPWCATPLPKELGEEWEKVLREEYNITDPWFDEQYKVPREFRTDEWWRKRDL